VTTIRTADGWSYTLSADDRIWLARAAEGEGGEPGDVIWAYLQRLCLRSFRSWTLSAVVQGHSQAINPDWLATGSQCRPGGSSSSSEACSASWTARRAALRAKPLSQLSGDVQAAIAALDAGILPNTAERCVDFATQSVASSYVSRNPSSRILFCRGNCFVAYPESLAWPAGFVAIGPSSTNWLLGAGLAIIAGALGWWVWRTTR